VEEETMRLIDADALIFTHEIARSLDDGHNWNELCITADEIAEAPTVEPKAKVIAQVTFDEEKMREIVKEAVERFKEEYEIEPKRGKWEEMEKFHDADDNPIIEEWQSARCSVCGKYHTTPYMYYFDNYNFCPNCGCAMTKERE
jgi:hypothetical protein